MNSRTGSSSRVSLALVLLLTLLSGATWAKSANYGAYPQPGPGYVTDDAHLLSNQQKERIQRWLWQVESRTHVEIIVVTVHSIRDYPGTANTSIEAFAKGLFDAYGVGNMPANNGVLLLVSVGDRKVRIELGAGYGQARDRDARRIVDKVLLPAFRKGDFAGGIASGVKAIASTFAGVRIGFPWLVAGLIVAALVALFVGISLIRSGKRGWGWIIVGLALVLALAAIYLLVQIYRNMPNGPSSGWSSGGMGGFGGGFSGGGGATGGW